MASGGRSVLGPMPTIGAMSVARVGRGGRVRMLVISVLNVTVATQPVFLLAAAAPQAGSELGFSTFGLGLLAAVFFLTAATASTSAGRIVERIGWLRAMRLTTTGAITTLLAIAVWGRSILAMLSMLAVGAVFYSFANPASNLALARLAGPVRPATFFGIKHAGIPASTLLAGLAVPLINLRWGWRWSYLAAAIVGLLLLALIPRRESASAASQVAIQSVGRSMTRARLRRLTLVAALATAAPGALGTFTVSAAIDAGLSESSAGWAFSLGGLATIAARILYGVLADRYQTGGLRPLSAVIGVGAVSLVLLAFASGTWFVPAVVLAFAMAWGWPGLLTYTVVEGHRARPAAASAVTQAGIFIGAGLGPIGFGWLVENVGYRSGWLVVSGFVGLGAAIAISMAWRGDVLDQEVVP